MNLISRCDPATIALLYVIKFPTPRFPLEILAKRLPGFVNGSEHWGVCRHSKSWQFYLLTSLVSPYFYWPPLPASGSHESCLNGYSSFLTKPLAFSNPPFTWWPERSFKDAWPLLLLPAWSSSGVPHHLQHKMTTLCMLLKALQGLATTSLSSLISQHSSPVILCSRNIGPFVTGNIPCLVIPLYLCSCFSLFLGCLPC